jgi:pilus assembly protein CpaB
VVPPVTPTRGDPNLKRSNRLVLLIGVFLAVLAFVGIALTLGGNNGTSTGPSAPPTELPTVIAAQDIPLGAVVTAGMLKVQTLPIDQRKTQAFQNPGQIIGQTARRKITIDAQLEAADFNASSGGLRQIDVPPGQRAIAVQVDQVSGVGTIIRTGDYVDMVVGLTGDKFPVVEIDPDDESITVVAGLNTTSVKLLIEGMQVLGTALPAAPAAAEGAPAPSGQPETTLTGNQELVILGVSAQQAEIIKFAQLDGSITLALRSPKDFIDENGQPIVTVPSGTTGVILKTLVDGYGVIRPELVEAILPAQ